MESGNILETCYKLHFEPFKEIFKLAFIQKVKPPYEAFESMNRIKSIIQTINDSEMKKLYENLNEIGFSILEQNYNKVIDLCIDYKYIELLSEFQKLLTESDLSQFCMINKKTLLCKIRKDNFNTCRGCEHFKQNDY